MKLSENTLTILKNFASINSGMVFRSGQKQKTVAGDAAILAEAQFDEAFPETFGVYDLNQFLGNLTALEQPELEFKDKFVQITDGKTNLKYFSCDESLIKSPPSDKELSMNNPDVVFELTNSTLTKLLKLAATNVLPHLSVVGKDGTLYVQTHDKGNDTSNTVTAEIGQFNGDDFIASFKTENLKLLPDDYTVEIKFGAFAKFKSKTKPLSYFVALLVK